MLYTKSKFLIIILIILFAFFASGCGGAESPPEGGTPEAQDQGAQDENAETENFMPQKKENPIVSINTNRGKIKIELFINEAPKTVENFLKLAQAGFYNKIKFHRVIPGFMIQTGDPNSRDNNWADDGMGGPGYKFQDEINPKSLGLDQNTIQMLESQGYVFSQDLESHKLERGILAMANSGPNTNGSQFFIITAQATPWLDGRHTAFGKVLEGMPVADSISQVPRNSNDHPMIDVVIEGIQELINNEKISE